jgi:hypothetical protein
MAGLEPLWRDVFAAVTWQAAAVAALLALVGLLAIRRGRWWLTSALTRAAVIAIAIVATLAVFDIADNLQNSAERRAIQARATEIAARAMAPGSPLGCLESEAGEAVENACEKAVFARPDSAAAAVAYTEARLTLYADALKVGAGDPALATTLAGLRRSIELDRFGLAAQVLATRDGCTPDNCAVFALLRDATVLKDNLKARAYDTYVARYAGDWTKEPAIAEAPKPAEPAQASTAAAPTVAVPLSDRYDFPSAASIPPVSIMNKAPPRPNPEAGAAAPAEPNTPLRLPPKRPQTQAAAPR